jgi:hypothetical protein
MEGGDNEEIVREREVHTKDGRGGERVVGVASRDAKRFLCLCDQGRTIGLAGHKKKQLRRDSFIVLSTKETTSHIS